jgi:hypothetical protein
MQSGSEELRAGNWELRERYGSIFTDEIRSFSWAAEAERQAL